MESRQQGRLIKRERLERNRVNKDLLSASFDCLEDAKKIIIDCSFDKIMTDFERSSLARQVQQCYAHLRSQGNGGSQMFVSSVNDDLMTRLHKQGSDQWIVHLHGDRLEDVIEKIEQRCNRKHRTIFMSPDADQELTPDDIQDKRTIFVLGGIVDRSVSRNETSHKAIRLGLESRRLPIEMDMFVNKVFNIDTVFLFLIRAFSSTQHSRADLLQILSSVVPDRKKKSDEPVRLKKEKGLSKQLKGADQENGADLLNNVKLLHYTLVNLLL